MRSVGVGLVGYSIGRIHTHAWLNCHQFYPEIAEPRLVAICGRNHSAVASFAEHYGFKKTYSEWQKMLHDPDVTVLDNCAPPYLHAEPCIEAAEQGKAVICEKPLGRTAEEAYRIYASVERTRQVHMTGFNKRFLPAVFLARDLLSQQRLGRVHHVVATYYNIEYAGGFANPNYPLTWMFTKEKAGHGAISDIGSHIIDMMRFVVGEITAVCGAAQTFVKSRPLPSEPTKKGAVDVDDLSVGCIRFVNGAIGTITASWMPMATPDYATLEVYGSKGSLRFTFERPNELELFVAEGDTETRGFRTIICNSIAHPLMSKFWPDQASAYGFEQSFISEIGHFLSCVHQGVGAEPLGASFYDGYLTCLLIDELIASSHDAKWHTIEAQPRL
jgi:predicted dehydrogenase